LRPDDLLQNYLDVADDGLGPDLLLGLDGWIKELADAGLIHPTPFDAYFSGEFSDTVLDAVTYQQEDYGAPMSLFPAALYFNKTLVQSPPATLEQLVEQTDAGELIALVTRFVPAYWGIQGFGHGLFDEEGNFTLDGSGFTEWLAWLLEAQEKSNIILNIDAASLLDLFLTGQVAYYAGGPEILPIVDEALGEDNVGIVRLPSGPNGSSGPLLNVNTILYNSATAKRQDEIAAALSRYLTNPQQSITFMRGVNRVPANQLVRVDPRVYPQIAGFSIQARTAVALPNYLDRDKLYRIGDATYISVLTGQETPEEAVCTFGIQVVNMQGYTPENATLPSGCVPESWTTAGSE
jgi:maltose-binding protein MalE